MLGLELFTCKIAQGPKCPIARSGIIPVSEALSTSRWIIFLLVTDSGGINGGRNPLAVSVSLTSFHTIHHPQPSVKCLSRILKSPQPTGRPTHLLSAPRCLLFRKAPPRTGRRRGSAAFSVRRATAARSACTKNEAAPVPTEAASPASFASIPATRGLLFPCASASQKTGYT